MANLDNTNKDLIEGVINLLRNEVSGWSQNQEYGVDNVWPKEVPEEVGDEFPRGIVDIVSGEDEELSINLDTRLRVSTLRLVIFSDDSSSVEELSQKSEQAITDHFENYTGDWTLREIDGEAGLTEERDVEEMLRYNKMRDFTFETIRVSD